MLLNDRPFIGCVNSFGILMCVNATTSILEHLIIFVLNNDE